MFVLMLVFVLMYKKSPNRSCLKPNPQFRERETPRAERANGHSCRRQRGSCTSMAELEHLERARGIDSPKIKRQRAESLEETIVDPDPTAMDR